VRRIIKFAPDTHCHLLPLLINVLPFYDDIWRRSVSFIGPTSCLMSDPTLVRSVTEHGSL